MKKIVLIGTGFHPIPPVKGAAVETWIDEVAKRFSSFKPYIISPYHPSLPLNEVKNGVTYNRIKIGRIYTRLFKKISKFDPYSYEKRIFSIIAKINPDIVHINNRYWLIPILRKKFKESFKIILHMHNDFNFKSNSILNMDALVGCSHFIAKVATEKFQFPEEKVMVLKNGVNLDRFRPIWEKLEKSEQLRERFNLKKNKVILFVGRISPEKGVDKLIRAFKRVNDEVPDSKLILVGEIRRGTRKNCEREQYFRDLLKMVKCFGENIVFMDIVDPNEIHNYYLLGDLFAASSINEAFGSVFLEASASGLPIVAVKVGGIPEAVKDNYSGILVNSPDDTDALAESMISLLRSKEKSDELGQNGRIFVEQNFDWNKIVKGVENFYTSLLEE